MKERFKLNSKLEAGDRVKDINILLPKRRSEFYVRLYTLFNANPQVSYEGYEYFIIDTLTGVEFSAGLTGFGPGYFSSDHSVKVKDTIDYFHEILFKQSEFKDCRLEMENDFGKTILGYENNGFIEIDEEG